MRVVVDTNVVVSALLKTESPPGEVIQAWRRGEFQIVSSAALLTELEAVLSRPRLRRRATSTGDEIASVLSSIAKTAVIVEPTVGLRVVTSDPDDDRVLEAAVAGTADYIVSGDRDLLEIGSFEDIPIVTPARFIAILAQSAE